MKISNLFLFSIFFTSIIFSEQIRIHSFFPEHNPDYRAEFIIYNLLKKRPIHKDIDFIYAPWPVLQKNTALGIHPNIHDIPKTKVKNGFTVCSHDNFEELVPFFRELGINTVFNACGNKSMHYGVKLITIPYFARNAPAPAANKDLLYSFMGAPSHVCRFTIFNMWHPKNTVIIKRDGFHYRPANKEEAKRMEDEYANVLSRSRFSLCPRGISAGSYRFWESLHAGAIPVLISDAYVLPPGFDWSRCIIKVKEKDINKIPQILLNIPRKNEEEMRKNCYLAYSLYSKNKFARVLREHYK